MEDNELNHDRSPGPIHEHAEDEMDAQLFALFRSIDSPTPSAGFADRTMSAVRRGPLPAGRRRLRNPMADLIGWAALVAGVAVSGWAVVDNAPVFLTAFTGVLKSSVNVGAVLAQFVGAGIAMSDVFATLGLAMSRIVVTKEGTAGLVVIALIGALSLSALHRLLIFEGPERGVSPWQEL